MKNVFYTTISAEICKMEEVANKKLKSFHPSRNWDLRDRIFHIFKSSSKAHILPFEQKKIYKVIDYCIAKKKPIKVSFLWALFWMVKSPFNFVDYKIVKPRLGDYWSFYWLSIVNEKIRKLFAPGCQFVIIDEFSMVKEMGWTEKERDERESYLKPVYSKFDCIKVVNLPHFHDLPKVPPPNDEEIIATIAGTPLLFEKIKENNKKMILDTFYLSHDKKCPVPIVGNCNQFYRNMAPRNLKKLIPTEIWDDASEIKTRMNKTALARRTSRWLDCIMNYEPFVDAAIIDKGRWSPDMWAFTSPQHGGSVLDLNNKLYSIAVSPEYRLKNQKNYVPILIKGTDEEYIFFWQKQ